jgi:D-alanyl-D-alanine carboxypeptidase
LEPAGVGLMVLRLLPLLLLAACAQGVGYGTGGRPSVEIGADGWRRPTHYYPPPGPSEDPWGPYIREAAGRYGVPERWVRAVMQQESGGEEQATSPVGAMGLMQVMPTTYDDLRVRHRLGDDPYEPRNNIMAGTAYIREMYDRYGAPGFLAAYNAGPDRVDSYLAGRAALPDETVNYVAAITPNLGREVAFSGAFARYASARSGRATRYAPTIASLASGCDLNAAYNANHPCTTLERAAAQPAPVQTASAQQTGAGGCDLNAAYDPNRPCTSLGQASSVAAPSQQATVQQARPTQAPAGSRVLLAAADGGAAAPAARAQPLPAAYQPAAPPPQRSSRAALDAAPSHPAAPHGDWAIQVGAFKTPSLARAVAEGARAQAPNELRSATLALQPTAPFGNAVLYRARLAHLSASAAQNACTHLNHRQLPCIVVPPNGS